MNSACPDRLASITAWICAAGILIVTLLGYHLQSRPTPAPAVAAELPRACVAPKAPGETLRITVTYRDGLLDVICRPVHAVLPLKRSPR